MAEAAPSDPLVDALRSRFGHSDFREGQREVVEAVIDGGDVVVVMPTGGGKSLCYQLPAVLGDGLTVVVSPLIALMNDQVEALRRGRIAAAALHSNIAGAVQRRVEASVREGALHLLYVAPERLVRPDFMSMMAATRVERLVVDEAHCISEWGHDFRRDYLRIGEVVKALAPVQVVACTATATADVREDIAARLHMRGPRVFVHGFARPNLVLRAERLRDEAAKLARLDTLLEPGDGHAIVYAGTRARAASLAGHLGARFPTMLYHADLGAEERLEAQERFRRGDVRVAVTTSAFGMGVDIPTVRQVIHMALPSSLEEYYQQAGRAGRDGARAECVVLHCPADRRLPEFFIEAAHPEPAVLHGVLRSLHAEGGDPGAWRLVHARDPAVRSLADAAGDACREILADAGLIRTDGTLTAVDAGRTSFPPGMLERIAAHRRVAFRRLQRLYDYLGGRDCRHRAIVAHFGEVVDRGAGGRCGDRCDVCAPLTDTGVVPARGVLLDEDTVRRALSAVARLNGRVGLARVAAVLVGSRSRQVTDLDLDRIPTYGALRGWREADAAELLRRLCDAGAVRQGAPPYPTVALTEDGVAAMRGQVRLDIDDPRRPRPADRGGDRHREPAHLDGADADLFESLRVWRRTVAKARDVPPYVVFGDRTLLEIARCRPTSAADLRQVPGIGDVKLRQHGDDVLRIVAEHRVRVVPGMLTPNGEATP